MRTLLCTHTRLGRTLPSPESRGRRRRSGPLTILSLLSLHSPGAGRHYLVVYTSTGGGRSTRVRIRQETTAPAERLRVRGARCDEGRGTCEGTLTLTTRSRGAEASRYRVEFRIHTYVALQARGVRDRMDVVAGADMVPELGASGAEACRAGCPGRQYRGSTRRGRGWLAGLVLEVGKPEYSTGQCVRVQYPRSSSRAPDLRVVQCPRQRVGVGGTRVEGCGGPTVCSRAVPANRPGEGVACLSDARRRESSRVVLQFQGPGPSTREHRSSLTEAGVHGK